MVGKLVGSLGPRVWAQVYDFTPEAKDKIENRGRLVAVVSMELENDTEQVKIVQIGREVLSRLHERYYGAESGGAFEVLKEAVNKVREEFEYAEISAVGLLNNILYVVAGAGAGVFVSIGSRQGWLVRPGADTDGQEVFSGRATEKEILVIGNKKFWAGVTEGTVRAAAEAGREEMETGMEMLTAVQRGAEETGGEAGVMIEITRLEEEKTETEEVTEQETPARETQTVKREAEEVPVVNEVKSNPVETVTEKSKEKLAGGWGSRIYIRHGDKQEQRKKMMYAGIGFLVLLVIMAGAGQVWLKQRNLKNSTMETQIEKLAGNFNEAKADAVLNPSRSRQLLLDIKSRLAEMQNAKIKDSRLTAISKDYEQVWEEASGVVKVNLTELINLSLLRTGMTGDKLAKGDNNLEVLDTTGDRVVEVDTKTGAGSVVAGGNNWKGARLLATYPGKILVMTDSGIMAVDTNKPVAENDPELTDMSDMKIYAGNIYLLDNKNGQIWRMNVNNSGSYGKKQAWLADGKTDDELKNGIGMAIDGSIWIIKPGGLLKYTRGVKESIQISGLETAWGDGAVLFTDENTQKLYVLDPGSRRVVILSKSGQYEKQLSADGLSGAKDMVVDESGGKLYFGGDGKVWTASL